MFFSHGLGATPGSAEEAYEYFTEYFEKGYYAAGPPTSLFQSEFFPFDAVVNLNNAELMDKAVLISQTEADFVLGAEIVELVQQANQ